MTIISRKHALALIRNRKAAVEGYTLDSNRDPEYIVLCRFDAQRVDHYRVTPADAKLVRKLSASN